MPEELGIFKSRPRSIRDPRELIDSLIPHLMASGVLSRSVDPTVFINRVLRRFLPVIGEGATNDQI